MDLTTNAFHLLRVSPHTPLSEIGDARDEAIDDDRAPEEALSQAQTALSTPIPRLNEEISCIFEASPEDCERLIMRIVHDGDTLSDVFADERYLSSLSRANLAAHVCAACESTQQSSRKRRREALFALIEVQNQIFQQEVEDKIKATRRQAGGLPPVNEKHIRDALKGLRNKHRQAAHDAICASSHPGEVMTMIAEQYRFAKNASGSFVKELARDYDNWSIPTLDRIEKEMDAAVEKLRSSPSNEFALQQIVSSLARWDEFSQPMQLLDEAKGLDETRSQEIFKKLRDLSLFFANECDNHDIALKLTQAMLRTFPELPQAVEVLTKDAGTLERIVVDSAKNSKAENFGKIFSIIQENPDRYASDISEMGDLARQLADALDECLKVCDPTEGKVFIMGVRTIGIRLHNEYKLPGAALALMKMLQEKSVRRNVSKEVRNLLTEDVLTLEQEMKKSGTPSSGSAYFLIALGVILYIVLSE